MHTGPGSGRPPGGPAGFTLIELMVVVLIVAILAAIGIPSFVKATSRARASAAIGDVDSIRLAAHLYQAKTGLWPAEVGEGITPPELEDFLGEGFSFEREHYTLDWQNWSGSSGGNGGILLGISVVTDEAHLGEQLLALAGAGSAVETSGGQYTFVVEGMVDSGS